MKKSDEYLQFKLRLPRELAEQLKRAAEKNMRSINAEVLFILKNRN
ncbi:Arc family DNA-binding protein [Yersinia pseudotuberculosis]|uniref:Arc domain protein DNA binding domain protein n=1 Tax=Yersinia pseudotuberculosis serotype O:3 (strain YPIII) TaxID=502800 RepID=A0A0H3B0X7_YERPY|nr:Arc family DNA-binding protein [Yersinia pseudotuberculosis]AJJ08924.1 arc-like DNA binding domain protein [Yersinia pseudotuberculosis]AJJ60170.1 arc-like DNA binding domain protein [Yersinia pseudotuberculosis YPIII]AYW87245.1 Arc family DNA-binding protein [Yersinia pseudotuberculosis]